MKTPKKITLVLLIATACLFESHASTIKDYQLLVDKWLNLHKQRNQLIADWQSQKPLLEQRLRLLNIEKQRLKEKLAQSKQHNDEVSERRNQILLAQSKLESEQHELALWLEQSIIYAHSRITSLPPPLANTWRQSLLQITDASTDSETLEVLLLLQSKRQAFNQRISFEKSKITLATGQNVLLEQIYIGEKLAYVSTPDGTQTGIGFVANNQWQWQLNNEMPYADFVKAKAMLQHRQEADFIALPVTLEQSQ